MNHNERLTAQHHRRRPNPEGETKVADELTRIADALTRIADAMTPAPPPPDEYERGYNTGYRDGRRDQVTEHMENADLRAKLSGGTP